MINIQEKKAKIVENLDLFLVINNNKKNIKLIIISIVIVEKIIVKTYKIYIIIN